MFEVRKYHQSDFCSLYDICLKTADDGNDASHYFPDHELPGHYFVGPYVTYEPDMCFVLTYSHRPIGYILGTQHTRRFGTTCENRWFGTLRQRYSEPDRTTRSVEGILRTYIHRGNKREPHFDNYPAHLHINILPEGQRKGFGKQLMIKFFNRCKAIDINGVYLTVSNRNENAVQFYRHLGFHELGIYPWGYQLGKEIQ